MAFSVFIWLFANFMSHTVAALVVIPIVCSVGCALGSGDCAKGHYQLLALGALLMDSTAMGLPVSSFPNAQMFALRVRRPRHTATPHPTNRHRRIRMGGITSRCPILCLRDSRWVSSLCASC